MSEKKIKVGDRVRITSFCVKYEIEPIYGTVVSIEDYGIGVELDTPELLYLDARDIEVVPPIDPRTAFLQELKELLSKYNATIFGLEMWASINGEQCVFENAEYLDSDNIMDYEE
ncbi:MAG: hypothetical protein NC418_11580 [Muribaculaceae bacterium]|nr:hypothetical protein [Muribaculaceae bacterium]